MSPDGKNISVEERINVDTLEKQFQETPTLILSPEEFSPEVIEMLKEYFRSGEKQSNTVVEEVLRHLVLEEEGGVVRARVEALLTNEVFTTREPLSVERLLHEKRQQVAAMCFDELHVGDELKEFLQLVPRKYGKNLFKIVAEIADQAEQFLLKKGVVVKNKEIKYWVIKNLRKNFDTLDEMELGSAVSVELGLSTNDLLETTNHLQRMVGITLLGEYKKYASEKGIPDLEHTMVTLDDGQEVSFATLLFAGAKEEIEAEDGEVHVVHRQIIMPEEFYWTLRHKVGVEEKEAVFWKDRFAELQSGAFAEFLMEQVPGYQRPEGSEESKKKRKESLVRLYKNAEEVYAPFAELEEGKRKALLKRVEKIFPHFEKGAKHDPEYKRITQLMYEAEEAELQTFHNLARTFESELARWIDQMDELEEYLEGMEDYTGAGMSPVDSIEKTREEIKAMSIFTALQIYEKRGYTPMYLQEEFSIYDQHTMLLHLNMLKYWMLLSVNETFKNRLHVEHDLNIEALGEILTNTKFYRFPEGEEVYTTEEKEAKACSAPGEYCEEIPTLLYLAKTDTGRLQVIAPEERNKLPTKERVQAKALPLRKVGNELIHIVGSRSKTLESMVMKLISDRTQGPIETVSDMVGMQVMLTRNSWEIMHKPGVKESVLETMHTIAHECLECFNERTEPETPENPLRPGEYIVELTRLNGQAHSNKYSSSNYFAIKVEGMRQDGTRIEVQAETMDSYAWSKNPECMQSHKEYKNDFHLEFIQSAWPPSMAKPLYVLAKAIMELRTEQRKKDNRKIAEERLKEMQQVWSTLWLKKRTLTEREEAYLDQLGYYIQLCETEKELRDLQDLETPEEVQEAARQKLGNVIKMQNLREALQKLEGKK